MPKYFDNDPREYPKLDFSLQKHIRISATYEPRCELQYTIINDAIVDSSLCFTINTDICLYDQTCIPARRFQTIAVIEV